MGRSEFVEKSDTYNASISLEDCGPETWKVPLQEPFSASITFWVLKDILTSESVRRIRVGGRRVRAKASRAQTTATGGQGRSISGIEPHAMNQGFSRRLHVKASNHGELEGGLLVDGVVNLIHSLK